MRIHSISYMDREKPNLPMAFITAWGKKNWRVTITDCRTQPRVNYVGYIKDFDKARQVCRNWIEGGIVSTGMISNVEKNENSFATSNLVDA